MAVGKIIKREVDAIQPGEADAYLWDTDLAGFGVKITPAGRKIFLVQYRLGGRAGKVRRVTIGQHGSPWTVDAARKEAQIILGDVAKGIDVASVRKATERKVAEAPTVADLAERFLTEHAEAKRKASTASEYRRLFDTVILPALGRSKVAEVSRQDVARLHHDRRSTPYLANRILAVLSKLFNLAEAWGYRPDGSNPCRHVEKFPERKRERFLSADELSALGEALAAYEGSPYVVGAVKLLIFTGARLSEVLGMRWEWVDLARGDVRLSDSKTGAKTLHLPPQAIAVLEGLPRVEGNPHVIVGAVAGNSLVNLEKPWRAIRDIATIRLWWTAGDEAVRAVLDRLVSDASHRPTAEECRAAAAKAGINLSGVGLEGVRLHDLRHAFASVGASSGMGLPIIGKLLGHSQAQTTARYAHLAADPVKAAAALIAAQIEDAMKVE
ncbi:putative prophage CPS-53 integrase [mine drainage metagenome]|uniref:Putative prophage CPS-53 integrase n=1 Tax=mine drainage metagenome TaxID=410659 RepID=A0A1J5PWH5_9ZZZZ